VRCRRRCAGTGSGARRANVLRCQRFCCNRAGSRAAAQAGRSCAQSTAAVCHELLVLQRGCGAPLMVQHRELERRRGFRAGRASSSVRCQPSCTRSVLCELTGPSWSYRYRLLSPPPPRIQPKTANEPKMLHFFPQLINSGPACGAASRPR
jgi:hypothetical protein